MDGHFLQFQSLNRIVGCPTYQFNHENRKVARRINSDSTFLFLTLQDVTKRPPCTTHHVFSSTHQNQFQISLLRCHFSVWLFEVEFNLNGNRPTLGVLKSASLSCRTSSCSLFTTEIPTAQFTHVTFSSTPSSVAKIDCTLSNSCNSEMSTSGRFADTHGFAGSEPHLTNNQRWVAWTEYQRSYAQVGDEPISSDPLWRYTKLHSRSTRSQFKESVGLQRVYWREQDRNASKFQQAGFHRAAQEYDQAAGDEVLVAVAQAIEMSAEMRERMGALEHRAKQSWTSHQVFQLDDMNSVAGDAREEICSV